MFYLTCAYILPCSKLSGYQAKEDDRNTELPSKLPMH